MPSQRFLRKSKTFGKEPRRMSFSKIESLTGNAAAPEIETLIEPNSDVNQVGTETALSDADTQKIITPNAICKYINVRFQLGQNDTNTHGWYEYAIVLLTEQGATPTVSGMGNVNVQTLGDICVNKFRGKCIWNGAVPINLDQTKVLDLAIKIPMKWCKWQRGSYLVLFHYYRPAGALDTDPIGVVISTQWKAYL